MIQVKEGSMDKLKQQMQSIVDIEVVAYQADLLIDYEKLDRDRSKRYWLWWTRPAGTDIGHVEQLLDGNSWITMTIQTNKQFYLLDTEEETVTRLDTDSMKNFYRENYKKLSTQYDIEKLIGIKIPTDTVNRYLTVYDGRKETVYDCINYIRAISFRHKEVGRIYKSRIVSEYDNKEHYILTVNEQLEAIWELTRNK